MSTDTQDFEYFARLLHYDAETGTITWRIRMRGGAWPGKIAGTLRITGGGAGYREIRIGGKAYRAHRIAWLLHYKKWPINYIDHINGRKDDNRINNLREATPAQNVYNSASYKGSSKYKGVSRDASSNKWRAFINVNKRQIYLGSFDCEIEAAKAYDNAAFIHFGSFARLNLGAAA